MADIAIANVVAVIGTAYARNADGELRELNPGDVLLEGETVVTPDGSRVELELTNGNPFIVSDVEEMAITRDLMAETAAGADESAIEDESVDAILAALESGEDLGDVLQATAAGGSASGPGGEGSSFIRLARISEDTPELSGVLPQFQSEAVLSVEEQLQPVDAIDDFETSSGEPVTIAAKANDIFLEGEIITDFTQAANGTVSYDQQTMLFTYTPNEGFSGTDTFTYDAINPTGTAGDTAVVTIVVELPVVPPVVPPEPEPEPPTISINDDIVTEGDVAVVTISLSKVWDQPITVTYQTADGSADAGDDYSSTSGTVTFAPGVTSIEVQVSTLTDDLEEPTENLFVNLSNPINAGIADPQGEILIVDDFVPAPPPPPPPPPTPPPPPPPPGDVDVQGGSAEVDEQFLEAGRSALPAEQKDGNLSRDGSFTVTAEDGLDFITIQPGAIVAGQLIVGDPITIVDGAVLTGEPVNIGPIQIVFTDVSAPSVSGVYTIEYTATLNGTLDNIVTTSGEPEDVAGLDTVVVGVQIVVGDVQGDTASDIQSVSIIDDVPDSQLSALGEAINNSEAFDGELPIVTVDETADQQANPEDTDADRQSSADFSGFFTNDTNQSTAAADDDVVFGADGPGSVGYVISLSTGGSDIPADGSVGVESGLFAASGPGAGEQVTLHNNAGVIEGRAGGSVYFTVAVNTGSGEITLTQTDVGSIAHPDAPDNYDEVVSLTGEGAGEGEASVFYQINLTQTVTDSEGDNDSETVNLAGDLSSGSAEGGIFAFNFSDDGPTASNEAVQDVAEGDTLAGEITFDGGADGAAVTAIGGTPLVFGEDGFSQALDIGDGLLKIKADGSYSFTANNPVTEPAETSAEITITDGDGDTVTAAISFNVTDANAPTANPDTANVDDEGLDGGIVGGTFDDATTASATFSDTLPITTGLDIPVSVDFAAMNGASGSVGQEDVDYAWTPATDTDNGLLTATINDVGGDRNGLTLFTVEVTNAETGAYTVTLERNVIHEQGPNNENEVDPTVSLTYTVTDADNSIASSTLTVSFDDDEPVTQTIEFPEQLDSESEIEEAIVPTLAVDETDEAQDNPEDNVGDRQSSADFSGYFATDTNSSTVTTADDILFGADGPGDVAIDYDLNLTVDGEELSDGGNEGVESGLYAVDEINGGPEQGPQILLYNNGGTIEGRVGDVRYFTVSVNGSGQATLTQMMDDEGEPANPISIWHPIAGDDPLVEHDDVVSLSGSGNVEGQIVAGLYQINLTQTVTDGDGDEAIAIVDLTEARFDAYLETDVYALSFGDDGPTANDAPAAITIEEDSLTYD
ncbi:MAG: retention module-containing protein, partial [Halioglobus sp.]